jgi:hypothetical protein
MVGLGPGTVVRGATFPAGGAEAVIAGPAAAAEDLLGALLLLEWDPHPAKPMPRAAMAIVTPLTAVVRFK